MKRGEIYWARLAPRSGSEQSGRRPAIVVSHDVFNRNDRWHSIIVVPISTSTRQMTRGPTAVLLPRGTASLQYESCALCHQVTTLDRSKLEGQIGHLPAALLRAVEEGLTGALGMPPRTV
ncbi:MAG: type II toxin-antitoxin system PemK/MazF family toxin [Candidatus Binataceae bacterium]